MTSYHTHRVLSGRRERVSKWILRSYHSYSHLRTQRERQRQTDRQTDTERDRETEAEIKTERQRVSGC